MATQRAGFLEAGGSIMANSDDVAAQQIRIYDEVADRYGASSQAVLWDDPQTQYLRFAELIKDLDLNDDGKTLLDMGCGNGELYKFLNFMGFRGKYVGYDINEKLIAQARGRFEGIDVRNVNIMTDETDQKFDYVLLSGLFNVDVGQTADWAYTFLRRMYALCGGIMVFNMVSTHVNYRDEGTFYMDPAEVLSFCIDNLSKRTTLAHHNLPYNYTVTVYRNEAWASVRESRG